MLNNHMPVNVEDSLYAIGVDVCIALDGDLIVCNTFVSGFNQMENAKLPVSEVFCVIEDQDVIDTRDWARGQGSQ